MLPAMQPEIMPTDYAIRLRPLFVFTLLLLMFIVLAKFIIHDLWGGISLIFVVLMGLFVLSGPYRINASSALFYSVMALISGVFDVISCVLYFQHSRYRLFDMKAPHIVLLAQTVFLISPIALFISAAVSYIIFNDCRESSEDMMPLRGGLLDYASLDRPDWDQAAVQEQLLQPRPSPTRTAAQNPATMPFQGVGRRLDGS